MRELKLVLKYIKTGVKGFNNKHMFTQREVIERTQSNFFLHFVVS